MHEAALQAATTVLALQSATTVMALAKASFRKTLIPACTCRHTPLLCGTKARHDCVQQQAVCVRQVCDEKVFTGKRRNMTLSSTSYMHTYLVLPPASRKAPSALKAREVKHSPDVELPRALLSDDKRPPARSLRPSMVPCSQIIHFIFSSFQYFTVWGVEPDVTHQTSWLGSTGGCGVCLNHNETSLRLMSRVKMHVRVSPPLHCHCQIKSVHNLLLCCIMNDNCSSEASCKSHNSHRATW